MNGNFDIHTILERRKIRQGFVHEAQRIFLICCGALVMGFNLNTFVPAADLIPGGFTGLVRLIQMLLVKYTLFLKNSIIFNLLLKNFNSL